MKKRGSGCDSQSRDSDGNANPNLTPKLTVLSREHCHLCEDMIAALKQFQGRYSFEIEVIDVDRHPGLEQKWGDKVPVLLDGPVEICRYHLDAGALDARLARMK